MLTTYVLKNNTLTPAREENPLAIPPSALWIDLLAPTQEEEKAVEDFLHIQIPTREEMDQIELSSRLYEENGALYLTATVIAKSESEPEASAVTFVLTEGRLITVRYGDPQSFRLFIARMGRITYPQAGGEAVFATLLEAIVDRAADILQSAGHHLDALSQKIFRRGDVSRKYDFQDILGKIGKNGDLVSKTRESIVSITRLIGFVDHVIGQRGMKEIHDHLLTIDKDVIALGDHAGFLSGKVNFLLDATLGMINIEQSEIIRIFSVAAAVFLPPTLIASVYGMNFKHMPELEWMAGYHAALALMAFSAYVPFRYFKRRGWL